LACDRRVIHPNYGRNACFIGLYTAYPFQLRLELDVGLIAGKECGVGIRHASTLLP
jgi:hypothetical protein